MDIQGNQGSMFAKARDMGVSVLHGHKRSPDQVPAMEVVSGFAKGGNFVTICASVGARQQALPAGAVAVISAPDCSVYPPALVEVGGIESAAAGINIGVTGFEICPGMGIATE